MPETVAPPEPPAPAQSRRGQIVMALGFGALAVALHFYLRLILKVDGREDVYRQFFRFLLPAALGHTGLFLALTLGFKIRVRGAVIFWLVSALVLLSFGSWLQAGSLGLLVLFAMVMIRVGGWISRRLFPPESQGWSLSLALGVLCLSVGGSFLAFFHLFKWWVLALLILAALVLEGRESRRVISHQIRDGWNSASSAWSIPLAILLQAFFLLGVYAYVLAAAPETNSDAIRFYWPYMKLLRHFAGFFDVPHQWSYIIPQAGITYGASVLSLLGKHAARLSMLLLWVVLIGLVCRRCGSRNLDARFSIALVVASCPAMLWVATSLMQDSFVCLSVVTIAVLCLEGQEPASLKFWAALGLCAGTAWAAKYSTLAYAAPLIVIAAVRSIVAAGWMKTLRGLIVGGGSALLTLSPWLVHSYRQCRNPVFPFLLNLFPSPLWPRGVGFSNLDTFRLSPGWRSWIWSPLDMTFHTRRFVEGNDGLIGITLLVVLILGVAALWKGAPAVRALALCAFAGTMLLWSQTAYLRYWLPGLWLGSMAVGHFLEKKVPQSLPARSLLAAASFAIMLPHLLLAMLNNWQVPTGWSWDVYSGKITWQAYLARPFGEFEQVERLPVFGRRWPKVWFTDFDGAGNLQVLPMDASVWELSLHANEPRTKIQYLCSAGSEFWIVNEEGDNAFWVKAIGISQFFWNEKLLIARSGPVAIYKMPDSTEALREFDERAATGTDLVMDGSFETGASGKLRFWRPEGETSWIRPSLAEGQVKGELRLLRNGKVRQDIALPPGLHAVELAVSARTCAGCKPVTMRYQTTVSGFLRDLVPGRPEDWIEPYQFLSGKSDLASVGEKSQTYRLFLPIQQRARYVTIQIDKTDEHGEAIIGEVHLFSR